MVETSSSKLKQDNYAREIEMSEIYDDDENADIISLRPRFSHERLKHIL